MPVRQPLTMTEPERLKISRFIEAEFGIKMPLAKKSLLEGRLAKRVVEWGLPTYAAYFEFVLDPTGRDEFRVFEDLVSTHETSFFREASHFQYLEQTVLPELLAHPGRTSIEVLSAASSTGEEAYTLAIILQEVMHDWRTWDLKIRATDVDQVRLDMARRAIYDERSVKEVPPEYFDRHIKPLPAGYFGIKPETTKLVEIEHLNLSDRMAMRAMRSFDFIFCRNVLIYFDDASRKAVVDHFYNSLKPGGFIFLGHSESIGRISTAFKLMRVGEHLVYRKE